MVVQPVSLAPFAVTNEKDLFMVEDKSNNQATNRSILSATTCRASVASPLSYGAADTSFALATEKVQAMLDWLEQHGRREVKMKRRDM